MVAQQGVSDEGPAPEAAGSSAVFEECWGASLSLSTLSPPKAAAARYALLLLLRADIGSFSLQPGQKPVYPGQFPSSHALKTCAPTPSSRDSAACSVVKAYSSCGSFWKPERARCFYKLLRGHQAASGGTGQRAGGGHGPTWWLSAMMWNTPLAKSAVSAPSLPAGRAS